MKIAKTTGIVIIACYWSSNEEIDPKIIDVEEYLINTINLEKILIVGDFNTRSNLYENVSNIQLI